MFNRISRGLGAVIAGAALAALGLPQPGAAGAVTAGTKVMNSPVYDTTWSGYQASGRWFRFISTTVTIPPRIIPARNSGAAAIMLSQAATRSPSAAIKAAPGGGPGSVTWVASGHASGAFRLSPRPGDRVALSLYYGQNGTDYFTATDLTQGITRTAGAAVGPVIYRQALLGVAVTGTVSPPQADIRLWQFTGSHLTTYTGDRSTITGPWQTSALTATTDGTTKGMIKASPSYLWSNGQNFGVWLRAIPTPTAYVVNQFSDSVTPIRTATNTALAPIPVGSAPDAIAITPDGRTAYVVNEGAGTVTPISTATNTALKPIGIGQSSGNDYTIAITPDGATAYVATSGSVVPINLATNTALKRIPIYPNSEGPFVIAITPDSKTAYVTYDGDTVTPISTATNTALKPIPVGSYSAGIAITPDGKTAYVTNGGPGTVTPINTATNTALKPITAGAGPIAITPDGKTAYVASSGADTVTPINIATNTALKPIPGAPGGDPSVIAITPDGATAYVLYQNLTTPVVTPIDTATNTALKPITVADGTWAIAITPDSKTAYVTNYSNPGEVTPIDTATNTTLTPIPVGSAPLAIAITPGAAARR
jgi:YVTN family beta-propeller protein